jgi:hypothetical protein
MSKFSRKPGMSRHAQSRYIHFGTSNENNLGNSKEARKRHIEEIKDTLELMSAVESSTICVLDQYSHCN